LIGADLERANLAEDNLKGANLTAGGLADDRAIQALKRVIDVWRGIVADTLEQAASRGFEAPERFFKLISVWRGSLLKTGDSSA
jgi:uncharacterized protein YjbI with pentapeptide repeats